MNPLSNYFFNVVSAIVLSLIAGLVIDKILEPRLTREGVPTEEGEAQTEQLSTVTREMRIVGDEQAVAEARNNKVEGEVTSLEKKALGWATITVLLIAVAVTLFALMPESPWRNEEGGFLPKSPLLDSIVFIIFVFFSVSGYVYGRKAGTVRGFKDVPVMMGEALKDMTSFLVLAFILGQFIALFNWSGIGSWIAVTGAEFVQGVGLAGFPLIIGFVLLCSLLNLFIISGSSMWTLMAAVFVPMLGILGFEPAFVQAAFRVGDSATQVMTPLNPYMVVLLAMLRKYEPNAGLGTTMARMIPFVVPFWLAWLLILFGFYALDLPLGPGAGIMLETE